MDPFTKETLSTKDVLYCADEPVCYVHVDHPVLGFMLKNKDLLNVKSVPIYMMEDKRKYARLAKCMFDVYCDTYKTIHY